ncbi:MAG: ABC-type transport system involved in multi-copper enzyme maturation permease subunit [Myxococcota bacterium]|jgi:ABC-type transport system involved in multi-copper enzyme maturation permease subunit
MIGRVLHIARREWLEQRRQPVMLGVIGTLYGLVGGIVLLALLLMQLVAGDPARLATLASVLGGDVDPVLLVDGAVGGIVAAYNFLMYSQFLGIAAVLAGHSVLHDRQCGTLTFLLLAPVRRHELLVGKVLGAVGPAFLLYVVISGGASLVATSLPVTAAHSQHLPSNPAWWVAFLLGGPLWAMFIGTVCTIVSSVAKDVRTSQQGVWFVVFFATLICGFLLTWALPYGVLGQLGVAALAAAGTAGAATAGAAVISRDVSR